MDKNNSSVITVLNNLKLYTGQSTGNQFTVRSGKVYDIVYQCVEYPGIYGKARISDIDEDGYGWVNIPSKTQATVLTGKKTEDTIYNFNLVVVDAEGELTTTNKTSSSSTTPTSTPSGQTKYDINPVTAINTYSIEKETVTTAQKIFTTSTAKTFSASTLLSSTYNILTPTSEIASVLKYKHISELSDTEAKQLMVEFEQLASGLNHVDTVDTQLTINSTKYEYVLYNNNGTKILTEKKPLSSYEKSLSFFAYNTKTGVSTKISENTPLYHDITTRENEQYYNSLFKVFSTNAGCNMLNTYCRIIKDDVYKKYLFNIYNVDTTITTELTENLHEKTTLCNGIDDNNLKIITTNGSPNKLYDVLQENATLRTSVANSVIFSTPKTSGFSIDSKLYSILVTDNDCNISDFTLINDINTYTGAYITKYENGKKMLNMNLTSDVLYGVSKVDGKSIISKNGVLSLGYAYYQPDNVTLSSTKTGIVSVNTTNIKSKDNSGKYGTVKINSSHNTYLLFNSSDELSIDPKYYTYTLNALVNPSSGIISSSNKLAINLSYINNKISSYIGNNTSDVAYQILNGILNDRRKVTSLSEKIAKEISTNNITNIKDGFGLSFNSSTGKLSVNPNLCYYLNKDFIISHDYNNNIIKPNAYSNDIDDYRVYLTLSYDESSLKIENNKLSVDIDNIQKNCSFYNTTKINNKDLINIDSDSVGTIKVVNDLANPMSSIGAFNSNIKFQYDNFNAYTNVLINRITTFDSKYENVLLASNKLANQIIKTMRNKTTIKSLMSNIRIIRDTIYDNYYIVFEVEYDYNKYYISPYCIVADYNSSETQIEYVDFTDILLYNPKNSSFYKVANLYYNDIESIDYKHYYKHNSSRIDILCGLHDSLRIKKCEDNNYYIYKNIMSIINNNLIKDKIGNLPETSTSASPSTTGTPENNVTGSTTEKPIWDKTQQEILNDDEDTDYLFKPLVVEAGLEFAKDSNLPPDNKELDGFGYEKYDK